MIKEKFNTPVVLLFRLISIVLGAAFARCTAAKYGPAPTTFADYKISGMVRAKRTEEPLPSIALSLRDTFGYEMGWTVRSGSDGRYSVQFTDHGQQN